MTAAAVTPVQRCAGAAVPAPGLLVLTQDFLVQDFLVQDFLIQDFLIQDNLFPNVLVLIYRIDNIRRSEPRP